RRGQGAGRERAEGDQGRRLQGRGRGDQEEDRGGRRHRRAQVIFFSSKTAGSGRRGTEGRLLAGPPFFHVALKEKRRSAGRDRPSSRTPQGPPGRTRQTRSGSP